jgi:hypothetical protein
MTIPHQTQDILLLLVPLQNLFIENTPVHTPSADFICLSNVGLRILYLSKILLRISWLYVHRHKNMLTQVRVFYSICVLKFLTNYSYGGRRLLTSIMKR